MDSLHGGGLESITEQIKLEWYCTLDWTSSHVIINMIILPQKKIYDNSPFDDEIWCFATFHQKNMKISHFINNKKNLPFHKKYIDFSPIS